jgi:protocatechuate 3,4-dioxygenase beta subunit
MTLHTEEEAGGITRRHAFGAAGAMGAALVLAKVSGPGRVLGGLGIDDAAAAGTCVLTPSKTEGPYFVDEKLNRSDIRVDPSTGAAQDGVKLALTMLVVRADGDCAPVENATVDIWHCNAKGLYSDESANSTVGKKYLRGYQVTGTDGKAEFVTIYPGWYSGRAIHIHFKVRLYDGTSKTYEFTSQMFFDPSTSADVVKTSAYSSHGSPDTSNSSDNIYGSDGSKLLVNLASDGNGGYTGTFVAGLSGLPASATTGSGSTDVVDASVTSVSWKRLATGGRRLKVKVKANETVAATARLTRSGTTLARKSYTGLAKGTRALSVNIPRTTAAGSAQLVLKLVDTAGTSKTITRTVTVPKRIL